MSVTSCSTAADWRRRPFLAAALGAAWASVPAKPKWRVLVMPKLVGIAYYNAVKVGVDAAVRELPELDVVWQGPAQDQVEQQIQLIERWIPQHPDLIAVAANDGQAIDPVLQRARKAGIHVMSWDADCGQREFFVNLVDYQDFGNRLVDALAADLPESADIAIVTTTFTAVNQVRWINEMRRAMRTRRPRWRTVDIRPAGESTEQAMRVARDLLQAHPGLKGLVGLGAPNLPGVAQAVRDAGLAGRVAVTGNSTPNAIRDYIKNGTVRTALLWNAQDHGYLTIRCAHQLLSGGLRAGQPFNAGALGMLVPRADEVNAQVVLPVLAFDKDNVDRFRF